MSKIGNKSFKSCENLKNLNMKNITIIENEAFSGCVNLGTIEIPDSVTSVGENAFQGVPKIIYSGDMDTSSWGAGQVLESEPEEPPEFIVIPPPDYPYIE